jgi:hypothetical protein
MQAALFGNFVLNFFLQGALSSILQVIQSMQLLIMVPMYKISMPANASIFYGYLLKIAAFDTIPMESIYDSLFS